MPWMEKRGVRATSMGGAPRDFEGIRRARLGFDLRSLSPWKASDELFRGGAGAS